MSSSESKNAIVSYLVSQWQSLPYREKLGDRTLYLGWQNKCIVVEKAGVQNYKFLESNQEEADGRLILHALDADKTHSSVTIAANDTDVFILCIAFSHKFSSLLLKSGINKVEVFDVKAVASSLGLDVSRALPGLHAYTGCDTVSAFSGRGKLQALKLLKKDTTIQETFDMLGKEWILSDSLFQRLNRFTSSMYST